jgi:hypothetical protein
MPEAGPCQEIFTREKLINGMLIFPFEVTAKYTSGKKLIYEPRGGLLYRTLYTRMSSSVLVNVGRKPGIEVCPPAECWGHGPTRKSRRTELPKEHHLKRFKLRGTFEVF